MYSKETNLNNKNKANMAQDDVKTQNSLTCEQELNAKSVWGMLVSKLKNLHAITLYTACGEIREVCFAGNTLIVKVKEDSLYNILITQTNKEKITASLKEINNKIEVKIEKVANKKDIEQENLNKLKSLFGQNLNLK